MRCATWGCGSPSTTSAPATPRCPTCASSRSTRSRSTADSSPTSKRGDDTIARSVIDLGHNLGLHVVAEGVESERALERLAELGCDSAQGYHLGVPMPVADVEIFLR